MNFMDYTNDACMNLFTLGQKSRMQAVLSGSRSSLQSSQGCVPVNLQNLDAGISAIITPNGTLCQSSITPEVTIKNFGLTTLTSATINYQVDAGPVNTYSWTGSLATLTTQNVTLPSITASAGAHTFTAYTSAPNGGIDDDPTNDTSASPFTVQSIGDTLPFFEGFENPTFPPAGWQVINPDNDTTWERTTLAAKSSTASARVENAVYPANEQIDELIFPNLDLTDVTYMTFDIAYQLWSQTGFSDTLEVLASTDCGSSYSTVYKNFGQPLTTVTPYWSNADFIPASDADWRSDTVDLSAYSGFNNVILKFRNINDYENNLYIDNINISVTTTLAANFTASSTTICAGETVSFTNQSSGGPTSWEWTFAGGTPGTSTLQTPNVIYNTPGTYDVTLVATNANGSDTLWQAGYITVNPNLSVTAISIIDITCNSLCDGEASVIIVGGTPGYAFLWSNGQTSSIATGLCGGNHDITITDTNGCMAVDNFTITEPPAMVLDTSSTDAACGVSDGSATVNVTGGTSPYIYSWSSGGTAATEDSLPAGIYTVMVIDFNGCTASTDVAVDNPGPPNVSTTKMDVSCNGLCDGAATATVSGATPPYTYLWNDLLAQTSSTADSLCAGSYFVLVADSNSCATTASVTITEPDLVGISLEISTDISCNGLTDGEIAIVAAGGTGTLNYSIDSGATFTNSTGIFTGLSAGTYNVVVQDSVLCTEYGSILIITEPSAITAPPISFTDDTNGASVGTASISVSGGTPPLNFTWSPSGGNDSTATGLFAGSYTVTVTDANGCIYQDSVNIGNVTGISELAGANNNIRFYPNPSAGIFTFEIQNLQTEDINIDIYNVLGKKVFTRSIPGVKDITQKIDLGSLPGGIYFVKLFIAGKVKYSRIAVVK